MGFVPEAQPDRIEDDTVAPEASAPVISTDRASLIAQRDKDIADLIEMYSNQREAWYDERERILGELRVQKTPALEQELKRADEYMHSFSADIAMLKGVRYAKDPDGNPVRIPWGQLSSEVHSLDVARPELPVGGHVEVKPESDIDHEIDTALERLEQPGESNEPKLDEDTIYTQRATELHNEMNAVIRRLKKQGLSKKEYKLHPEYLTAYGAWRELYDHNVAVSDRKSANQDEHPKQTSTVPAHDILEPTLQPVVASEAERAAEQETVAIPTESPQKELTSWEDIKAAWNVSDDTQEEREESDFTLPGWNGESDSQSAAEIPSTTDDSQPIFEQQGNAVAAPVLKAVPYSRRKRMRARKALSVSAISDHNVAVSQKKNAEKEKQITAASAIEHAARSEAPESSAETSAGLTSWEDIKAVWNASDNTQEEREESDFTLPGWDGTQIPQSENPREISEAPVVHNTAEQPVAVDTIAALVASAPKKDAPVPVYATPTPRSVTPALTLIPRPVPQASSILPLSARRSLAARFRPLVAAALAGAIAIGALAAKLRADENEKRSDTATLTAGADMIQPERIEPAQESIAQEPVIEEEPVEAREVFNEVSIPRIAGTKLPDLKTFSEYEIAADIARKMAPKKKEAPVVPRVIEVVAAGKLVSPLDTDDLMIQRGVIDRRHGGLDLMPGNRSATAKVRAVADATVTGVLGARPTKAKKINPDARSGNGCGNGIILTDVEGNTDTFCHLQSVPTLRVGDTIAAGEVIGDMGASGNAEGVHLHWKREDRNGKTINPLTQLDSGVRIVNRRNQQVFPIDGTESSHDHRGRKLFTESDLASMRGQTFEHTAQVVTSSDEADEVSVTASPEQTAALTSRTMYVYGPTTLKDIALVMGREMSVTEQNALLQELVQKNPQVTSIDARIRNMTVILPEEKKPAVQQVAGLAENPGRSGM